MEIIYRACDGKEFDDEADCCYYENSVLFTNLIMLDLSGNEVNDTSKAAIVWIGDRIANKNFHSIAKKSHDEEAANTIPEDSCGLFYWSEGLDEYCWLSKDILELIKVIKPKISKVLEEEI